MDDKYKSKQWEVNQIKSFTSWANYYLQQRGLSTTNILQDFKSGVLLINLLEILFKDSAGKYYNPPKSRTFQIENANIALNFMKKHGIPNRGCGAEDIVDGSTRMLLGMIWTIAREAQMDAEGLLQVGKRRPSSSGARESVKEGDRDEQVKKILLQFVQGRTGWEVKDFSPETWKDGKVLAALVSSFDKNSAATWPDIQTMTPIQRIEHAIKMAQAQMSIPRFFTTEDLASGNIDPQSLMLYTSLLLNHQHELEKLNVTQMELDRQVAERKAAQERQREEERRKVEIEEEKLRAREAERKRREEEAMAKHMQELRLRETELARQQQEELEALHFEALQKQEAERFQYEKLLQEEQLKMQEEYAKKLQSQYDAEGKTKPNNFPNMPVGGEFQGAAYVTTTNSTLSYNPASSADYTSVVTSTKGKKKKGLAGFANRLVQETAHKFDKAYAFVSDNDTSFSQFRKYFRFKEYEPLYGEFPCKFASSEQHMMIGAMYVTPNYLCFSGELMNNRLSVILAHADIESIDEGVISLEQRYKVVPAITPAVLSSGKPNALLILDSRGKLHRLFSFSDTVKAYHVLFGVWSQNPLRLERLKQKAQVPLTPPEPSSRVGAAFPIAPPPIPLKKLSTTWVYSSKDS